MSGLIISRTDHNKFKLIHNWELEDNSICCYYILDWTQIISVFSSLNTIGIFMNRLNQRWDHNEACWGNKYLDITTTFVYP